MASQLLVSNLRRHSSALLRRCAAVKFYGEPFNLDNLASTSLDSRVLDVMRPYQPHLHGNCHSRTHKRGWDSAEVVEKVAGQVTELIGATVKEEIIFTSGATESNNLSVRGVMHFCKEKKKHVIILQNEHKCVGKPLYLDMQATSPVDPSVLDAMLPYYIDRYWVSDVLNGSAEKSVGTRLIIV